MKAVAFNGSPRQGGNTEFLLNRVLDPIREAGIETELIQVGSRPIRGCTACRQCWKNRDRRCAVTTDEANDLIARMIEADAMILGSPTYFADLTAEMKALIDRAGYVAMANGRLFSRKIGAAVTVNRRGGAMHTTDSINHLFQISRMIVPGSTYWNFGVGREKEDVRSDEEALANMRDLGETIAWLMRKLKE